jgi:tetratricopeptide (TPR) repeat protein
VLVTSRDQLAGLVIEGAHSVPVDLLGADEARALLAGRLGVGRLAAERGAVDEIVRLCARLPLALAVVAARAATHPRFGLAALAGELRAARGSLDQFAGADPAVDPRAVFSWSYLRLSAAAGRLFRLLGLHPGPDISARAAASLAGLPPGTIRPLLAELTRAHLAAELSPGRYACHDLLRAYAREQAHAVDPAAERRAATRRVLLHYVHSANHADRLLDPRRDEPPTLTALPPGVDPERPADHAQALAWFDTEHRVLLSAIHQDVEFDSIVWELVWVMRRYLAPRGYWRDRLDALGVALAAARRLGDPLRQAYAHCYLGCTHIWFGKYEDARACLQVALDLYRDGGDVIGQAYAEHYLSWTLEQERRVVEALAHAERALALFRAAGHQAGQAKALNAIGWYHALSEDHLAAVEYCQQALELQTQLDDQVSAAPTWHSLGYAHDRIGDHARATTCYRTALVLYRASGYRVNEAQVLLSLGDTYRNTGDLAAARLSWQAACDILEQLGHPDAAEALARLVEVGGEQRSDETWEDTDDRTGYLLEGRHGRAADQARRVGSET